MKPLLLISILFLCLNCAAQKFTLSLDAQLSLPQGDFKASDPNAGIGFRAGIFYHPQKEIPFKIGLELGLQETGRYTQYFDGYVFGFFQQYQETASNNIFSLLLTPRLQSSKKGKVKPFIDGIIGWNVFFSTVKVEELYTYSNNNNNSYSNSTKAYWAFCYGGAAGIDIPLNKRDDLGLELKCAYIVGSNSKYLSDPQIDNSGQVYFTQKESSTTMLIPQAGVRITL